MADGTRDLAEKPDREEKKTSEQLTVISPAVADDVFPEPAVNGPEAELEYVPDGGKEAWIVVLGSSLALFSSAGMINAYVSMLYFRYSTEG